MQAIVENDTYRMKYQSLAEFLYDSESAPYPVNGANKSDFDKITSDRENSWRYGTEHVNTKFFHERFEPVKGKKLCEQTIKELTASKDYRKILQLALTHKKKVSFKDYGSRIDVARAISGDDNCFIRQKTARKPIARIAINVGVSACVTEKEMLQIAKTAIPVIFALEQSGICTEVWLVAFVDELFDNSPCRIAATEICVKTAQQRFNWTMFAPFFQTGTFRHSIFLTWTRAPYKLGFGYGTPLNDTSIKRHKNFGYTSVIGNNNPGYISMIKEILNV